MVSLGEMEFIREEQGQGALEYILTVGMIIVAAVVIFSIYGKMTKTGLLRINESTDAASSAMSSRISSEVVSLT